MKLIASSNIMNIMWEIVPHELFLAPYEEYRDFIRECFNMHIVVEKKILAKSLSKIHSVVERRGLMPVLANVKIETGSDNDIVLAVTDMDLYATDTARAEVIEKGGVTLPVHLLFDIIRKLPDMAKVSIESSANIGEGVTLRSEAVECNLPTLPVEDFPTFAQDDYSTTFVLPNKKFKSLLTKTKYAMSTEETRYYLNGIYLHSVLGAEGGAILKAVATDSHRLAAAELDAAGIGEISGIVVPRKAVQEVVKLVEDGDEGVSIAISSNKIMFKIGSTTLASKLVDGKFPDYKKAIPAQSETILEVGVEALSDALDLVTTISSDKTKPVKFVINNSSLTLAVYNNINGSSKALQQLAASYNGAPLEIAFNGKYVADVLSVIEGQTVMFSILDSRSAVLVRDSQDSSALHVLMPMQV